MRAALVYLRRKKNRLSPWFLMGLLWLSKNAIGTIAQARITAHLAK